MSINLVTSGLVSPSASGMINGVRTATQTSSGTVPDCTINPVNSTIDASNSIYDGQTILSAN